MNVAILGASPKPDRFAYKAFKLLLEFGHTPYLVNPNWKDADFEGHKIYHSLGEIKEQIDTLTMYVGAAISTPLEKDIIELNPRRVVFNPGSENTQLAKALLTAKIKVVENCTLVMLRTGIF
jgi:predicted CoA-binding protein